MHFLMWQLCFCLPTMTRKGSGLNATRVLEWFSRSIISVEPEQYWNVCCQNYITSNMYTKYQIYFLGRNSETKDGNVIKKKDFLKKLRKTLSNF